MPAVPFNPLAAVIVHSQVPVNPLTFQMLENEAALLIHSCPVRGERQPWIRYNREGKMIVYVRHSPRLFYNVSATALDPTGENLGNFHPGRCLSDRLLAFLNAGRMPFQFNTTAASRLILNDPAYDPEAGGPTAVTFQIEHAFVDLDLTAYPGGSAPAPTEPELFATLPVQSPQSLTVAAHNALLHAVLLREDPFASASMTLQLYDGSPSAAGVPVSAVLNTTAAGGGWIDENPPATPQRAILRNATALEFLDGTGVDRTATHLAWRRNGILVAEMEFSAPQFIPAYHGLRIPALAIGVQLTWTEAATGMAELCLYALFGSGGFFPEEESFSATAYDGSGLPLASDFVAVPRAVQWSITGATAAHTGSGDFTATDLGDYAPVGSGGWSVAEVRLVFAPFNACMLSATFAPPLTIPDGYPASFPASALTLMLS